MSVFCITSRRSVGCTFFDWTIHFLSGQQEFYQADQQQWIPLSQDPVLKINAHGHQKNHPEGIDNTVSQIKHFLSLPQDRLYSTYPTTLWYSDVAKLLGIPFDIAGSQENWQKINQLIQEDHYQLFEYCNNLDVKLIYVDDHPSVSLYLKHVRLLERRIFSDAPMASEDEAVKAQQQIFFNNSINTWDQLNLTDIWDQRERQALDNRPFDNDPRQPHQWDLPHLWLDSRELWTRGESVAVRMLDFLGLELVPERLAAWQPIYAKWQEMQLKMLEFSFVYQHIVDSIVNNWYYEIDLTFEQEVIIQHCLIYQHNLNLKTWQLAKFPNNTQALHKLLEPNIHTLTP